MTTEYEAVTESEWKDLATTEITHLTDEEKDYLPHAWDEWIARVRRAAQADALRSAVQDMGDWADEVYVTGDPLDEDTWAEITTGEWLTARADTIEQED